MELGSKSGLENHLGPASNVWSASIPGQHPMSLLPFSGKFLICLPLKLVQAGGEGKTALRSLKVTLK